MSLFNYECDEVKRIIDEVSPNYPQLTTYEKEWIFFHKYNYIPGIPVDLEYETVSIYPSGSVSNAIPYSYKSAILKGNTGYRDIDTGEFLETFEEGRNLELVSVKMPVLTTTGKNLFDGELKIGTIFSNGTTGAIEDCLRSSNYIKLEQNIDYVISNDKGYSHVIFGYNSNKEFVGRIGSYSDIGVFKLTGNMKYIMFRSSDTLKQNDLSVKYQIEKGTVATPFEPYKSNILAVNEDATLRSNGSVYDELDLLTGKLTQRINENGEVLSQEIVKTVGLTPLINPYEGTNHYELTSNIPCEAILEVPVVSTGNQTLEEINN